MSAIDLMKRVEQIYQNRLETEMELTYLDDFVAIEPDSGEYFLGRTLSEAAAAGCAAYPTRRTGVLRVGHPATLYLGATYSSSFVGGAGTILSSKFHGSQGSTQ
jgi:hypothetical protein